MTRQHSEEPDAQDRLNRAIELRIKGWSLQAIADELGYKSLGTLSRRIRAELRRRVEASADGLLELEQARLDELQVAFYDAAQSGDPRAAEMVLKVMERRAKLTGVDDARRRELEQAQRELTAEQAANVVGALTRIFAALGLSEEQRAMLSTIVPREMGRVTRDQAAIEGEVVDDGAP